MRARVHPGTALTTLSIVAMLSGSGCGPSVDPKRDLQVVDVTTGWFDAGLVDGKNKLVPSITFALKNVSDHPVASVQLMLGFQRKGEDGDFDEAFLAGAIDSTGVAAGAQTPAITLRGKVGYTSEEPRAAMLQHRLFVDATAKLFAKSGSAQWTPLGEFPVERRLLTR